MVKIRIEPWKSQSVELLGVLDDDAKLFELKDTRIATKISGWVGQLRSKRIKAEIVRDGFWISWIGLSSLTDRSEKIRALSNRFFQTAKTQGCRKAGFLLNSIEGAKALPWVLQGLSLGSYRFDKYKSKEEEAVVPEIQIFVDPARLAQCRGTAHEEGPVLESVESCRDLINGPANEINPQQVAKLARSVAAKSRLACRVLEFDELKRKGYNGLVNVGKGGSRPPCMVILSYKPAKPSSKHLCLVGKGITFDSGGFCLKPPPDMWEMKTDMAGAGAVLYAMEAIARRKPAVRVTGILCLAENLIDSNAYRPGDIFVAKNGKSIHIGNTDAEGRLVLTDGLCRAGEEGATHIVDAATLTGACVVALGNSISGLFANDKAFKEALLKSADETGELYWELPLHQEYRDLLKTPYADINNVGNRDGGAIQAALFLKEFVPAKAKWIHLDIAGPAFTAKPWKYFAEGATGMGLRTLVRLADEMGEGENS